MRASVNIAKAVGVDSQATQPWDGIPATQPDTFRDDLELELERLLEQEAGTLCCKFLSCTTICL